MLTYQPPQNVKPYESKPDNQHDAFDDEKGECRPINPTRLMNIALNRTCILPQLLLVMLRKKSQRQCCREAMQNIADEIADEEKQGEVNHGGECKVRALENPANSRACEAELAPMLRKVAGVVLILRPKLSACHLSFVGMFRVPGLFVGIVPGLGTFCGAGGLGGGAGTGRDGGDEGRDGGVGLCGVGINLNGVAKPSNKPS